MAKRTEKYPEVIFRKHSKPISPHPSPWVRQPGRHLSLFLVLVCLSCGSIAIDVRFGFGWLVTLSGNAAAPIVYTIDLLLTPVSRSATYFGETLDAKKENERLRQETAELRRKLNQLEGTAHETLRLRGLLNLKAEVAPEAMAAEVLRYQDSPSKRVMRLRGGTPEGFSVGQPVLAEAGQLLGRIVGVNKLLSTVRLITDPACRIGVFVERTQAQGILYNRDGYLFIRLDRGEIVAEGDRVLTSHLSNTYPKGLLVGEIGEKASPEDSDPVVAVEMGHKISYHVVPAVPTEKWKEYQEVLCLPNFEEAESSDAAVP
jgi:rod shape-determining protein MreC